MSSIGSVSQFAALTADKPSVETKSRINDSAEDFESLLLAQMLRSMREANSGWLGTGEDTSATPVMELAEEQFAKSLSASGGLGLAKMVSASLKRQSE